jgi:SSS family solute:Na+ symporter
MQLHPIDWLIIGGYIAAALGVGVYFSKRASANLDEFFVAGRTLPWWVAGTSIVATTFAVDTPLVISGFVRGEGIYANWLWWCILMGGMLSTFFYARLWRRAGIITDVEFIELRYEGRSAALLRVLMAVYGAVLKNAIIMGWVILAMAKVCDVLLGWDRGWSITIMIAIAVGYTLLSGFWGVVVTDVIQFALAMGGSIALMAIVLVKMGGPSGMVEQIQQTEHFDPKVFHMVPDWRTAGTLAFYTFIAQISVQWWEKGQGDGYIVQRFFATKDEKNAVLASLWFNFAHYVLRPWPWIVVGLASLVFFPYMPGEDPELAYPHMIAEFLPVGVRGLMVASLVAAFMSTMDTQLNWGASYLVNDVYKRFMNPDASQAHYVLVSRLAMLLLVGLGAFAAWQADSVAGAWKYLITLTAGVGFVGLLRWFWWRINAWSEISALVSSVIVANGGIILRQFDRAGLLPVDFYTLRVAPIYDTFASRLVFVIGTCTVVWVVVTFLTRRHSNEHLKQFYRRVRPGGWWGPVARECPEVKPDQIRWQWIPWFLGVVCIYSGLFGVGYICLARPWTGLAWLCLSAVTGWIMLRSIDPTPVEPQPNEARHD